MLKATKQAIKDTGVGIYDIELARIRDEQDVTDYELGIAAGAELGAQTLICSIWTPNKEYYIEQFAKLCGIADKYNINVMLEFVTFASVNNLKMAKEVIEATKPKNASLMIDTLHFSRSRVDIEELNDLPCPVKMAHICDGPASIPAIDDKDALIHTARAERLYIGEGAIDIKSIIGKLPSDTVLSIELPHLERVIEYGQYEHARRCLESAKNYFSK
jgi:sugar phosphate isomerase/epimerase